jgi:hypothetical protein
MKKIFSYLAILMCLSISFILESCSTDSLSTLENVPSSFEKGALISNYNIQRRGLIPANNDNPYDSVGRTHNIKEAYYLSKNLRKQNVTSSKKTIDNHSLSSGKVPPILSESLSEIINNWDMTAEAKLSFSRFINSLLLLSNTEERYETLYDFIVDYEASILISHTFTEKDKETILTNSSVVRYSTYEESIRPPKNKDPDWTIFFRQVSAPNNVLAVDL